MHRGHAILAVLVAAAALWAYGVTHPGAGGGPAGHASVPVWEVPLRSVQSLAFSEGAVNAELEPRWQPGADAPYVWVTAKGPAAHGAPATQAPGTETAQAFKGNAAAGATLKAFASLTALRDLGRLTDLDAPALGLEAPKGTLTLTRDGGAPLKLELGRATFGDTGRYAHRPDTDHVFLLRATELRRLAAGQAALMDRRLLDTELTDATRVTVTVEGQSRTFHRLADPQSWGLEPGASQPVRDVTGVLTALERAVVTAYRPQAAEGAQPGAAALEVRWFAGDAAEPLAWVRVYLEGKDTAWAVSSHTRNPVELAFKGAQTLVNKARPLVKGA